MTQGRKPHPDQRTLAQDPDVIAREEDKRRIRRVKYHHVVAWCKSQGHTAPNCRQWDNVLEVLTFLRYCEWANEGNPTAAQIANGCSKRGRKMRERSAERALGWANHLGVLFSVGQGRSASNRTILYARLREMIAAIAEVAPSEPAATTRHLSRQREQIEAGNWRGDDADLAGRKTENGGSILYSDPSPLPDQPTTTALNPSEPLEWLVVVEDLRSCGVSQAKAAIGEARARGATLGGVRELLDYWRVHHQGWLRPDVVLYRRVGRYQPEQPADEGWPSFDNVEYLQQREQERQDERRTEEGRRIIEQRRQHAAQREQAAREWTTILLVAIAAELNHPELARGIEKSLKRMAARKLLSTLPGTELTE